MVTIWQYGSNMDEKRLNGLDRLNGDAIFSGLAIKFGYELAFTHTNTNGVGVSDIVKSENDYVIGCLFTIPKSKIPKLDSIEGVNSGAYYRTDNFVVTKLDSSLNITSRKIQVPTYVVVNKEINPKTNTKYANHILKGIKDHKIGLKYFNKVKKIILENNPRIEKDLISYSI